MHEEHEMEDEGPRSFTRALDAIGDGDFVLEASEDLHRLLQDLRDEARRRHGTAKGTFTLKLTLGVEWNGPVEVKPAITTKADQRKLSKGHLWLTPGGNLTASNPRQQKLALREVGSGRPPRDVGTDNHEAREV